MEKKLVIKDIITEKYLSKVDWDALERNKKTKSSELEYVNVEWGNGYNAHCFDKSTDIKKTIEDLEKYVPYFTYNEMALQIIIVFIL